MANSKNSGLMGMISKLHSVEDYRHLHWEGSFSEYLDMVRENPNLARNAFQRMYDMIMSYGTRTYTDYKKEITHYNFFDDPIENGKDAVFGLDVQIMKLVNFMRSAALGYGTEKRVLLLHGPVGSAKSTIARLLKKGIERYSYADEGAIYTFKWIDDPKNGLVGSTGEMRSPMNEDPLLLIPENLRGKVEEEINRSKRSSY